MPAVANLAVAVTARVGSLVKGFRKASRAVKRFVRNTVRSAKRVALAFTGMATVVGFALFKILRAGEMFSRKMRRSLAIMGDVSAELRDEMKKTAISVARDTVFSAEQAAESYFFLASAGLTAKQAIKALPQVAQFAQAGMFDMARATDLLTDAQSALGLTVADAGQNMLNMRHVSDVLVKANAIANASTEQFSEALTTKAGPALKFLKKDIEEGVAVLAAFADQGIKSSEAGTALNIVLRDLSTKAIKNKKEFERVGIAVFDASENMRNLAHIVADVEDALSGESDEMKKSILLQLGFSDKSVIFLQTLLGMSRRIHDYEVALRAAGGTTKMVAAKQLTPMEVAVAKLGAAWTNLSDRLSPIVTAMSGLVTRFAKRLDDWAAAFTPASLINWIETAATAFHKLFLGIKLDMTKLAVLWTGLIADLLLGLQVLTDSDPIRKAAQAARGAHLRMIRRREDQQQFQTLLGQRAPGAVMQLWGVQLASFLRGAQKIVEAQDRLVPAWEAMFSIAKDSMFDLARKASGGGFGDIAQAARRNQTLAAGAISPLIRAIPGVSLGRETINVSGMDDLVRSNAAIQRQTEDMTPRAN